MAAVTLATPTGRHHAPRTTAKHAAPRSLKTRQLVWTLLLTIAVWLAKDSRLGTYLVLAVMTLILVRRFVRHGGDRVYKMDPKEGPVKSWLFLVSVVLDVLVVVIQHAIEASPDPTEVRWSTLPMIPPPVQLRAISPPDILTMDQKLIERFDLLRIGGEPYVTRGSWQRGM